ncbi:MAG: ECF transporter S component [Thermoprotei archaeon]|nr:ECF transporter S component [Thermoprotei archaeon]
MKGDKSKVEATPLKISAREIAYTSMATALVYLATSISVPMPPPLGVWHCGDLAAFIIGIMFGKFTATFSAGVGATLFDIWNPLWGSRFITWAPATIVIRSFMGFLLSSLRGVFSKNRRLSEVLAMIIASTEKNLAYFAYDYALFGPVAYLDIITFFPETFVTVLVSIPLLAAVRKALGREYIQPPEGG